MYPDSATVIARARLQYGLLPALTDELLESWITYAQALVDPDVWGTLALDGMAALLADRALRHPLSNGGAAFGGRVASVSTGGASVSYGLSGSGSAFSETAPGRRYEQMRDSLVSPLPFVVGVC